MSHWTRTRSYAPHLCQQPWLAPETRTPLNPVDHTLVPLRLPSQIDRRSITSSPKSRHLVFSRANDGCYLRGISHAAIPLSTNQTLLLTKVGRDLAVPCEASGITCGHGCTYPGCGVSATMRTRPNRGWPILGSECLMIGLPLKYVAALGNNNMMFATFPYYSA